MNAMDRHKVRVSEITSSPIDGEDVFYGEASDDLTKWLPLATGAVGEIAASQMRKKEEAEREKKLKESESYKAKAAALDARKAAEMAKADAITEQDPGGPKHRLAADLELKAQAAEQKSSFFEMQARQAAAMVQSQAGMGPGGYGAPSQSSNFFTTKNILIAGGVLAALTVVVLVSRK